MVSIALNPNDAYYFITFPFPLCSATSPKKHVENVHRGGEFPSTHAPFFNGLLPALVVQISFLWV